MGPSENTRSVIKKRTVKVQAHERKIAQNKGTAAGNIATGQRYAALGKDIAQKHYASKPLAQRKADLVSARAKSPEVRTRGQRVALQTHGERVSVAGQARAAGARRYGGPNVNELVANARRATAGKAKPITGQTIIANKLAEDSAQAKQLRAGLGITKPKGQILDRKFTNAVGFIMKQLQRPSTGIGATVKARIMDPAGAATGHSQNTFKEGFLHPDEHASDWDDAVKAAGVKNKYVRGGIALGASVATDPTTYLAFGSGTLAREAGSTATKAALKAHGDVTEALRAGRTAARATGEAGQRQGVKLGIRGLPVHAATGKRVIMTKPLGGPTKERVSQTVSSKVGSRSTGAAAVKEIREGVRQKIMNPNVKPRGWEDYEFDIARQAGNTGRAMERGAQHESDMITHVLTKATKDWDESKHIKVINALEHNAFDGLDPGERAVADRVKRLRELWYAKEPGRPELLPESKVGFHRAPEAPTFDHPVEMDDLYAARDRVENAPDAAARRHAVHQQALLTLERRDQTAARLAHQKNVEAYNKAPVGYMPRRLRPEEEAGLGHPKGVTARGPNTGGSTSYKGRKVSVPLSDMTHEEFARYETNIPKLVQARHLEHGRIMANKEQHKWMAGLADPVNISPEDVQHLVGDKTRRFYARDEHGVHPLFDLRTGEVQADKLRKAVESGQEISEIDPSKLGTIQKLIRGGHTPHEQDIADLGRPLPGEAREAFLKRMHRSWKWWATAPNPSYHARNAVGDTFNALGAGTTTGDFKAALRLNHINSKMLDVDKMANSPEGSRALEVLRTAASRSEHYPATGELSDLEVLGMANKYGAINSGIISGELRELQTVGEGPVVQALHLGKPRDAIQRAGDYRENIARLATFRNGLKKGMSPPEAAAFSLRHHIDYSNLSEAEVKFWRYTVPFWTWWSRNLPLQARSLASHPGLYANTEKARRQSLITAGIDPNIAESMGDTDQENLPWATGLHSGKGKNRVPLVAGPGLSYMDLGSIPYPHTDIGTTVKNASSDLVGRVNPFIKLAGEEGTGVNPYTFQQHEQHGEGKYVTAPAWLPANLPGVKEKYNKKTGQMEKQVNWRTLSVLNTIPVVNRAGKVGAQTTTPGKAGPHEAIMGWLTGPKYSPLDPRQLKLNQLYDQRAVVDSWIGEHKGNYTHTAGAPWTGPVGKAYKHRSKIQKDIDNVSKSMGFKNIRSAGRPKGKATPLFGAPGRSSGMFGAGG